MNLSPRQQKIVGLMKSLPALRPPLIPLIVDELRIRESEAARELVALYTAGAIRLGTFGFYV